MMDDILDVPKKTRKPRESSFWQQMKQAMKQHEPKWSATRLESRVTHGVPDVLLLDHRGHWHLVELKTTERNKVDISPHQVAFASKHSRGSCWIAVKLKTGSASEIFLYRGESAMDLRMEGLVTEPALKLSAPVDWPLFFQTLANR
tara:strand:+ start:960 stop:1397 length:438 start_codon:yes stop_codon:yes gene_type:complete